MMLSMVAAIVETFTVCLLSIKQSIKLHKCTNLTLTKVKDQKKQLKTIIFPLKKGWKQKGKSPARVLKTNK